MFGHERFEAYQIAIQFLRIALELVESVPPGYSVVKDQLKRAALSVPLNIAEGSGKNTGSDRKRYYAIARGSAMECAAICDVVILIGPTDTQKAHEAKKLLRSVVAILTTVLLKDKDQD